eukprot:1158086-Pelagomonas_calceolata.AAC.17
MAQGQEQPWKDLGVQQSRSFRSNKENKAHTQRKPGCLPKKKERDPMLALCHMYPEASKLEPALGCNPDFAMWNGAQE